MKKLFSLLMLALLTMSAWAQTSVVLDFTTNDWGLPTDYVTVDTTYSNGTYSITLGGGSYKFNETTQGNYLIFGKTGAYLTLPAFDQDVKSIVVTGRSGASGKTVQNIFVDTVAVSTPTTGATGTNTYAIAADYQAAGTIYTLKVLSEHNSQVTKIEICFEEGETPPAPEVEEVGTLAAANALADAAAFKFTGEAVVTYHNGKYMFLRDSSGYGLIYYDPAPAENMANGTILAQNWTATKTTYKGLTEYTGAAGVQANGTTEAAPEVITALDTTLLNAYVTINHVKSITGTTATLVDGTTITLYNRFNVTIPEFADADCSMTGIVSTYNSNLQLYFISTDYDPSVTPEPQGNTFVLVTDVAELADGDQIILVNSGVDGEAKAMGAINSNGNNFSAVDVTVADGKVTTDAADVITLVANGDNWNLMAEDKYIYAASSTKNNMGLEAAVDTLGNANASIAIADTAAIVFQGPNSHNAVRYNQSSTLFSCYLPTGTQKPVYIYKATEGVITVAAPVFAPVNNTHFTGTLNVTITCETEGATIYYSTDGENYTEYTAAVPITENTKMYAYAQLDEVKSTTVIVNYYKDTEVANIAEANALDKGVDFVFNGEAIVTYQWKNTKNGYISTWIKDATGYGLIYGKEVPEPLAQGTVLVDGWSAQKDLYNGVPEFKFPNGVEASEDVVTVEPVEMATVDTLDVNKYIIMKGQALTIDETDTTNCTWTNADGLKFYNQFFKTEGLNIESGKTYDVVGIVTVYKHAPEVYIISAPEVAAGVRGDVDGDGDVAIADVTALIDLLLSGAELPATADANLDNEVSVSDVTAIIDYLLSGNWPN